MNDLFVHIKVDCEERPDIDTTYHAALQILGEQSGWPLTIFHNPAGEPFWGGTYFRPSPQFKETDFTKLLQGVEEVHRNNPDYVENDTQAIRNGLKRKSQSEPGGDIAIETMDAAAERLVQEVGLSRRGINKESEVECLTRPLTVC